MAVRILPIENFSSQFCILEIPHLLLESLRTIEGFDEQSFLEAHGRLPTVSIRKHPLKQTHQFDSYPAVPWCPSGRYLPERPSFTSDPAFHAGAYYVQEASSMFLDKLIRSAIDPDKPVRVLDLCAAPGGKSTLIASLLHRDSLLVSNDVIRTRASILEENMTRWGYMNTWVTSNDPRDFGRIEGYFDIMIVDAPCSGSGLFRKDTGALTSWSTDNVNLCSQRQQRIIADVWPSLKQDGLLVYATCSFSPEENEAILDWLADNFEIEGLDIAIDEQWGIVKTVSPKHQLPAFRFFPGKVQGEGFFVACLRKKDNTGAYYYSRLDAVHNKKATEQSKFLLEPGEYAIMETDRGIFTAIRSQHVPDWHLLKEYVYLRKAGTLLGVPAQKEWIPEHDVAMSVDLSRQVAEIALDEQQALRYLKKEMPDIPGNMDKGWYVATYEGLKLGWMKVLGNRVNNYLPKQWRIRKELDEL